MQIKRQELVELLVSKTGLQEEEVSEQLDKLTSQIIEAVEAGESFEIEGFGTFSMQDDVLQFDPSDTLKTEINHSYAGMQPIELIGAFKDVPDVEVEEAEDQPEEMEEEKPALEQPKEVDDKDVREEPSEEPEPVEEISEPIAEEKKGSSFELDTDASEDEEDEFESIAQTKSKDIDKQPKQVSKVAAKGDADSADDPIGKVLVAAVIVITLGISGWFVYDLGLLDSVIDSGGSPQEQILSPGAEPSNTERQPANQSKVVKEESGSEQNQQNDVSKNASIAEQSRGSIYGLKGGAVPEAKSAYTIVVHSLKNESRARSLRQQLNTEGYVTILKSAVVNGNTYWRLGLGQFKNIEDAKQAVQTLPDEYRENNFIRKF